ncbi:MAG: hypothetical protein U5R06_20030 [candidate division KSB1 bacterium]|nr:hypothetical protein [candidate division KSB1 bacterium]
MRTGCFRVLTILPSIRQIDLNKERALCQARLEIETTGAQSLSLQLNLQGESVTAEAVSLQPGRQQVILDFEIHNPQLWYPREPCLYTFTLQMYSGKDMLCENVCKTGLRTLELVREPPPDPELLKVRTLADAYP